MKKQVIFGSLLALSAIANAQGPDWAGSASTTGDIYRSGNVGIGLTAPTNNLHIKSSIGSGGGGITIEHSSTWAAIINFKTQADPVSPFYAGANYALFGSGKDNPLGAGCMGIYDYNFNSGAGAHRFVVHRNGNVGVGDNLIPLNKLEAYTSSASDDGVRVTQAGSGSSALFLTQTSAKNWALKSDNAGNFKVDDNTGSNNRLFIEGSTGRVGIGTTSPVGKLHSVATDLVAVRGDASYGSSLGTIVGVAGTAYDLAYNYAVQMIGTSGGASGGSTNYGGQFNTSGGPSGVTSYGVYARVNNNTAGGVNYGVYSTVNGNSGGGSASLTNNAGYFNGDVVTTSSLYYFSDKRIKKDILQLSRSLDIINKLNPVSYNFDTKANPHITLPEEKQYGFISQEVKEVLPELTKTAIHPAQIDQETGKEISPSKEVLGLNYNGFIAILTKGIQEQQQQIEQLKAEVNALKSEKATGATGIQTNNTSINGFALEQNVPNPFSQETVINYTLPAQVKNASLLVYDLSGKQISSFPINSQANSITLSSEKLAAGIYIYSVVADGKILDSKRMVVAEKQ